MPCLLWLSVAGIIYGALVALAQSDLKRLIAYSSVSHLGFCMLGIFALNRVAVQGGALQMINHGLSTGGLFALVGMIYERYHTRRIADFGGIAAETPVLAFFMVFMTLASIGLPGLNGFVGEFLLLMGMFQRAWGSGGDASGPRNTASFPCWPSAASCWGPGTCCRWWPGSSSAPCGSGSTPGRSPTSACARSWPWFPCAWSSSGSACSRSSSSTAWPPASTS